MSNVAINIAAQFVGKKAFKQAETSTDKLTKSTKKLAKGLLAVYSAQKLMAYGKASVKAFAEDDKAATALGMTLKNLQLAYGSNIGTVNGYINRLEQQTGVLDDELRPAMDRFLRATMSVSKSQELLNLALDISAGTGKSVTQVSQSLQKAYLGQNQALGRLGVGLSKAELTSSSFEEIQQKLNLLFAGQATAAADTYAGSLAKLTVASNNAKETIGKGLVDAFITITNSSSVDDLITKIDSAAESIANFVRETGEFIRITKSIFDFKWKAPSGGLFGDGKGFGNISMSVSSQDTQKADAAARAKAAAAQLKATNAVTKSTKENLKLSKAKAIFDLQKIQIEAALKGKISEEDRIRLKLMQAIADENISDIEKYTKALDAAQKKTKELQGDLDALKANKFADPFAEFRTGLGKTIDQLTEMNKQLGLATIIQPNLKEYTPPKLTTTGAFDKGGTPTLPSGITPPSGSGGGGTSGGGGNVSVTVVAPQYDAEAEARRIRDILLQAGYRGTGDLVAI
jgi:hypothetical protein